MILQSFKARRTPPVRRYAGITVWGWLAACAIFLLAAAPVPASAGSDPLKLATINAPPFAYKDKNGKWIGLSIDLWDDITKELGLTFVVKEYQDMDGLLGAVADGTVDAGGAAITITGQREERLDFSHPYYFTGLGIATPASPKGGFVTRMLRHLLSPEFMGYIGALLLLLLLVGYVIWRTERGRNAEHFRKGREGVGDGVWWSAVTMTTVGYGDLAPKTFWGRLVGLVWMFASLILVSFFTAGITASLTVEQLGEKVKGPQDLPKVRTGCLMESSSESYLEQVLRISPERFATVAQGLQALGEGKIDAFVHDQGIIQYYAHRDFKGRVDVLKSTFDPQTYGFAFPRNNALRKPVNVRILELMDDRGYRRELKERYFGRDDEN